jgi:hypothetical protein
MRWLCKFKALGYVYDVEYFRVNIKLCKMRNIILRNIILRNIIPRLSKRTAG